MPREAFLKLEFDKLKRSESVGSWIEQLNTESTIKSGLYSLNRYAKWIGKNPDELLEERDHDLQSSKRKERFRAEDQLMSFAKKTKGGHNLAIMVKSFYKANHLPLEVKIERPPPARDFEKIPSEDELFSLSTRAPQPLRTIILFLIESGARIGSVLQLTYNDIKEDFEANRVPCMIRFPSRITKGRMAYKTFVGKDSLDSMREYFASRESNGEKIRPDTLIFLSRFKRELSKTSTIPRIQRYAYKTGINTQEKGLQPFHPHVLRKRAQTMLESSNIPLNWVDLLLGHKPRGASAYAYSRPSDSQLRDAYMQAMSRLSIRPKESGIIDKKALFREFVMQQASNFGLDPMEIKIQKQRELGREVDDDEAIKLIQEATFGHLRPRPDTEENGGEHKVIQESDLVNYLDEGWQIVREMNHGGKVLMRRL